MTEERQSEQPGQNAGPQAEEQAQQKPDLVSELQDFGQHLEAVGKAVVRAIQQRSQTVDLDNLEQRARKAAQQVQEAPLVRELETTLVSGLKQLNQHLQRLVERIEERQQHDTATQGQAVQHLQIEHEEEQADQTTATESPPQSEPEQLPPDADVRD